jgi:hypothetical protein
MSGRSPIPKQTGTIDPARNAFGFIAVRLNPLSDQESSPSVIIQSKLLDGYGELASLDHSSRYGYICSQSYLVGIESVSCNN